ncbi:MAG: nicotinate-nucleotide adenylyltransferase [Dehalococcoidia bacterium]
MRIGLLGGTFDPIHFGHILAAKYSMEHLSLDQVLFMPAGHPYLKADHNLSSSSHRLEMVKLATAMYPQFVVSDIEILRNGPSYTIDTVQHLENPENELVLIFGSDVIEQMNQWKDIDLLFDSVSIVFINRDSTDYKVFHQNVEFIDLPIPNISSTEIRQRIDNLLPVEDYLPKEVIQYIYKHNLYQTP